MDLDTATAHAQITIVDYPDGSLDFQADFTPALPAGEIAHPHNESLPTSHKAALAFMALAQTARDSTSN